MVYKIAFLLCCVVYMAGANEGESCVKEGVPGTCINIRNCPGAIQDLKNRKTPQRCSFIGSDPVVCCTDGSPPPQPTPAPTPAPTLAPTQPPTAAPVTKPQPGPVGGTTERCEPLDSRLTSNRTGQKAWDMCLEYQQKLVYPCKRSVALGGGFNRYHLCHHNADDLIIGGEDAAENEFTHMVLLGYGSDEASVQWQCGGSLISDQWVLTAGHCTVSRELGPVTYLQIGALKRSQLAPKGLRRVAQIVSAPQYAPPARYHDIALVKADTPVKLDQFLVPACVHVGDPVPEERVLATGWGLTDYKGSQADHLQKVILDQFTFTECSAMYGKPRLMKQGVDDNTQSCYGHKKMSKDTCQGDSGGPIMIKSKKMHCMYVVTGVTSFGKRCGKIGDPAIYTRVRNYVDWIESVVWPSA